MKELDEFLESDFGKKCAEWLAQDLKENGPLLLSTIGQGRFLPEEVSVTAWVSRVPGVDLRMIGEGRDYCVSAVCPGDVRVKRTKSSVFPQWILEHRRELYKTPVGSTVKSQREQAQGSVFAIIVGFLRRFFFGWINGRTRHVPRKVWNRYLEQLKNDDSLTVWIRYRDKRPSFTASAFLGGDDEAIMVKSENRVFQVERDEVMEMQLVTRVQTVEGGNGDLCRCIVSAWYCDRGEFGFVYDGSKKRTYFFDRSGIRDYRLLKSLQAGVTRQVVECRVINHDAGKKYARVEVVRICDESTRDSVKPSVSAKFTARSAMLRGDLKLAEFLYLEILQNPRHPDFEPALKDLAELYNRSDSHKALALLDKFETLISPESRTSLDNMRFLFYRRANMPEEARRIAEKLLRKGPNPTYEQYVKSFDAGTFATDESEQAVSSYYASPNFVPFTTAFGEYALQGATFPDGWKPEEAELDELKQRFKDVCSQMSVLNNTIGSNWMSFIDADYSNEHALMQLRLCAIAYWECQRSMSVKTRSLRNGWKLHFYRRLQCCLGVVEHFSVDSCVAALVWTARCSMRNEDDRYQKRLPLLLAMLCSGASRLDMLNLIDGNDFDCDARARELATELAQDENAGRLFRRMVTAYGLERILVNIRQLVPDQKTEDESFDYEKVLDQVRDIEAKTEAEVSVGLVDAAWTVFKLPLDGVESDEELKAQAGILLEQVRKYAGATNYVSKRDACKLLQEIWPDFEDRFVGYGTTVYTTDVYYPVLNALQDAVAVDFARCMLGQVELSLVHQQGAQYESQNGMVTLKLKLVSEHESAPVITSFSAYVVTDGKWTATDPDAICTDKEIPGGESYVFELRLAVSASAIERGAGDVEILLQYTTDGGCSAEQKFVVSYTIPNKPYVRLDNPYASLVGAQATGEYLVGREDELRRIRESFDGKAGGQCFVLWGQRRSGKSSIWASIDDALKRAHGGANSWYLYTPIDAQSWGDDTCDYIQNFVNSIAYEITQPDNVGEIPELRQVPSNAYFEKLACITAHLQGLGMSWVIGIDEVTTPYNNWVQRRDEKYKYAIVDYMRFLKSCLSKRLFHLVLIGQDTMPNFLELCGNEFAVTNIVPLSYLKSVDVRKLIDLGFVDRYGQSHITDAAFERIDELTNGAPFFIHPLCSALVRLLNDENRPVADVAQVNAVFAQWLRDDAQSGWWSFEQWTCLNVPGLTEEMARCYYHRIARKTVDGIWATKAELVENETDAQMFDILVKRKILRNENGRYRLWVNLFTEWLLVNEEES